MVERVPEHFSFEEMTVTGTGLPNVPVWDEIENLKFLCLHLEVIRAKFGKPIKVNSAFRSRAANHAVGGVSTSAHCLGLAADICACSGKESDNRALLAACKDLCFDQLIHYHQVAGDESTPIRFIHFGLGESMAAFRNEILCK